jgi:hypothetical protein
MDIFKTKICKMFLLLVDELKQAVVAMMVRKDDVEEQNRLP